MFYLKYYDGKSNQGKTIGVQGLQHLCQLLKEDGCERAPEIDDIKDKGWDKWAGQTKNCYQVTKEFDGSLMVQDITKRRNPCKASVFITKNKNLVKLEESVMQYTNILQVGDTVRFKYKPNQNTTTRAVFVRKIDTVGFEGDDLTKGQYRRFLFKSVRGELKRYSV